jgi:hypothetical protein
MLGGSLFDVHPPVLSELAIIGVELLDQTVRKQLPPNHRRTIDDTMMPKKRHGINNIMKSFGRSCMVGCLADSPEYPAVDPDFIVSPSSETSEHVYANRWWTARF